MHPEDEKTVAGWLEIQAPDLVDQQDRDIAHMVYNEKKYLGPLGMIEVGVAIGRLMTLRSMRS